MSGAAKIHHAQVGHHQPDIHVIQGMASGQARRVVADGGDEIALAVDENPGHLACAKLAMST